MIAPNLSPTEREFYVQLRSLLLKAVDLIERRAQLGKYKGGTEIEVRPGDSIAVADWPTRKNETVDV